MILESRNINIELEASVRFFLDSFSKYDISYGLVPDTYKTLKSNISSIAGTGYLFSALVIGSEFGYIEKELANEICIKALKTLKRLKTDHGWYYHFYDINNGKNTRRSEVSNIDSALLFMGVLTAGEYFKGEAEKLAREIFNRADFNYFLDNSTNILNMAVDYKGKIYAKWDYLAEQQILYILGVNTKNPEYRIPASAFYSYRKELKKYEDLEFYVTRSGSLFTYQYTYAYVDFRNTRDKEGVNWFENSVKASKASYLYAKSLKYKYKSIHELSWGLTACAKKGGYECYENYPLGDYFNVVDGTMAPTGALSSIVFTPEESIKALDYYYSIPELVGKYGLTDSYNEDINFYCDYYISIDKGNSMVMLANYLKNTIWKHFMNIDFIKEAMNKLEIHKEA